MNTLTWLTWLLAALVIGSLTSNPLYLVLIMLVATLVFVIWREETRLARTYQLFFIGGFALWIAYLVFSVITVGGARGGTVLVTLPELQLPVLLGGITIGGKVTAEDLAWGGVRGLRIWTLIIIFGTFNALVNHYRLLRLAPRSLFHAGLAVTIATTFVPQVIRAISDITESQRLRGHRLGGPKSYVALVAPLLAGSLERSIELAEALDARGYGRTRAANGIPIQQQIGILAGVMVVGGGLFVWLYYGAEFLGGGVLLVGITLLAFTLHALGRLVPRTIYRRERWRQRDTISTTSVVIGAGGWIALWLLQAGGLAYNPYPVIAWPPFDPLAGVLLLTLAAPTLLHQATPELRPPPARHIRPQRARSAQATLVQEEETLARL